MKNRDPRFDFSDEDIRSAVAENRLLSMEIEFTRACNYLCSYCYAVNPDGFPKNELSKEEFKDVLSQGAALGARKVVILGGEPLLYGPLEEMLDFIASQGMVSEIFTNGSLVTPENAAMLLRHGVRVIVKLNTLNPELHDSFTGVRDSLKASLDAIRTLRAAGYGDCENMLGTSTILSSLNIGEAPAMRRMLREKGLLPYFECITPQGRLLEHKSLMPDAETLRTTFDTLAEIDREYGYDWTPQPPLVGQKCFRHLYSCVIQSTGTVVPCVGLDAVIGNVRTTPLREILSESQIIRDLKNYRQKIKGPCRSCDKFDHCYGCRGTAYQTTGDYLASDPTCWLNADKLDRIHFLPADAAELLPHGGPMSFIGKVISLGEKSGVTISRVREDNPFLHADGSLANEALIEYSAQTAAALDAFEHDGKVSPGLLIEVLKYRFEKSAAAGDEIEVRMKKEFDLDVWHGLSFRVLVNGKPAAEGELKLCIYDKD